MCDNDINACKSCCQEDLGNKIYGPCFPTETRLGLRERCYNGVCNEQGKCVSEKDVPCGNGVLDTEEECDAGEESLKNQDKCCNSTCHLRESAQCSGFNKPCCKDCKIAPQGTDCEYNFDLPCMESAKCDGVSTDCPSAVPKENGAVCIGEGQCINGTCITKDCNELGKKEKKFYRACICDRNVIDACKRCCQEDFGNKTYGECLPRNTPLGFRERCYNGVCNEQGKCVPEKDVPCGNGVLDTEEECDAGEESLKNQDKCCNRTCHLKESAQCSGFNKPCCTDCKIAKEGTNCEYNFELPCMESAKCDGVSADCPSAVPKENGIACRGEGQCINGRCITTYCKELGEKDNRRYRACMCDHDASVACKRCCLEVFDNDTNGPCFPTTETLRPGQRCYNGECDEKGECIPSEGLFTVRLFNFFNNLDFDTLAETMKTNLVMTVVFLTALFWIPISCCISCMDGKNKKPAPKKPMARKKPPTKKMSSSVDPKSYEMRNVNPAGSSVDSGRIFSRLDRIFSRSVRTTVRSNACQTPMKGCGQE
ncbi:disintegrin and metalloproteinase domain-containing protein 17-like [Pomacea canaliculata]|uniref:disintegrin and metalloproteinase domain-containing protein 17-like n=1 Tax=Pomacea canaliculata TaxID=400727 RepID=UPI000D73C8D0|nr:disintegrin and metalloproteinase domain-containing protein 17-like [Pomacea canaliculata]